MQLSPEQVCKKKEQISKFCTETVFAEDKAKFQEKSCTICLVDFKINDKVIIIINCSHIFHENCIKQWVHAKILSTVLCPNCNKPILAEESAKKVSTN